MNKKLLSAILTILLIISAIPSVTAAEVNLLSPEAETAQPQTNTITNQAPSVAETEAITEPTEAPATEAVTEAPTVAPTEAPTQTPTVAPRKTADIAATAASYPAVKSITPTQSGLKLTWTAITGASKYVVYHKVNNKWTRLTRTTATSYEHKGLTSNTSHTYTVRAINKSGKFISDYNRTGYTKKFFAIPHLVRVESTTTGQRIVWDSTNGATNYRVYIKSGSKWVVAGTTSTSSCTNTHVTSGKAYTYTVCCYDKASDTNLSAYDTKGVSGTYIAAPTNTSFNAISGGVTIKWSACSGTTYYGVFRKYSTGWKQIAVTSKPTYTDKSIRYNARYTYTIRCLNSSRKYISDFNHSGWSFTHLQPPSITSISYKDQKYTLKWQAQQTAHHYRVFRKEQGGSWITVGKPKTNTFTDTTAKKTGIYSYTVRTMDEKGNYLTYFEDTGRFYRMGVNVIGPSGQKSPGATAVKYTCEVTEAELRQQVAVIANGWIGAVEGDATHKDILAYYNTHSPLAVNYKMQTHDAWCAAFTSAVWIRAGIADYIGTECGCGRFIDVAKDNGIWIESDSYTPKVGDAIMYYWNDSGIGDCARGADHIGIVTSVKGKNFTVTEGNTGTGYCGTHDRTVNQRYIRGYIAPNYAQIAQYLTLKAQFS